MKSKKTLVINIIVIFFIALFLVPFFREYNTIMNIDWIAVEQEAYSLGSLGQDIVFCPGYLKFFPTSYHLFGKFNPKTKPDYKNSYYQDYILVGFCDENTKYTYRYKPSKLSLNISRKTYEKKVPLNIKDIYKQAQIRIANPQETKECVLSNEVFDCGALDWQKLGLHYDFIDGKKIMCFSAHPQENSKLNFHLDKIDKGEVILGYFDSAANIPDLNNEILFEVNNRFYVLNKKERLKTVPIQTGELSINVSSNNVAMNWVCVGYKSDY